jgi:phosphatidylserine synthase
MGFLMKNRIPRFLHRPARWAAAGRLRLLPRPTELDPRRDLLRKVYRCLPNAVSLVGVLPLCLLLTPGGQVYLPLLIVFNNAMDDLDGMLARWLRVTSRFGFRLDNVCDAAGHTLIAMAVGAQFGGWGLLAATAPSAAILVRMTSRLQAEGPNGLGSTTNELMRHLLFVLLSAQAFGVAMRGWVIAVFLIHAVALVAPIPMPHLLRSRARAPWAVGLINAALVVALLAPRWTPLIALPFVATFISSLWAGLAGGRPRPRPAAEGVDLDSVGQGRQR